MPKGHMLRSPTVTSSAGPSPWVDRMGSQCHYPGLRSRWRSCRRCEKLPGSVKWWIRRSGIPWRTAPAQPTRRSRSSGGFGQYWKRHGSSWLCRCRRDGQCRSCTCHDSGGLHRFSLSQSMERTGRRAGVAHQRSGCSFRCSCRCHGSRREKRVQAGWEWEWVRSCWIRSRVEKRGLYVLVKCCRGSQKGRAKTFCMRNWECFWSYSVDRNVIKVVTTWLLCMVPTTLGSSRDCLEMFLGKTKSAVYILVSEWLNYSKVFYYFITSEPCWHTVHISSNNAQVFDQSTSFWIHHKISNLKIEQNCPLGNNAKSP